MIFGPPSSTRKCERRRRLRKDDPRRRDLFLSLQRSLALFLTLSKTIGLPAFSGRLVRSECDDRVVNVLQGRNFSLPRDSFSSHLPHFPRILQPPHSSILFIFIHSSKIPLNDSNPTGRKAHPLSSLLGSSSTPNHDLPPQNLPPHRPQTQQIRRMGPRLP